MRSAQRSSAPFRFEPCRFQEPRQPGSIERVHRGNVRVNLTFKPAVGEAIREWVNVPLVNRN